MSYGLYMGYGHGAYAMFCIIMPTPQDNSSVLAFCILSSSIISIQTFFLNYHLHFPSSTPIWRFNGHLPLVGVPVDMNSYSYSA